MQHKHNILTQSIRLGVRRLASRRLYLLAMVAVPLFMCIFFATLLQEGLPNGTPTAVVDGDHSSMSRSLIRKLNAQPTAAVVVECESFDAAMDKVRSGQAYGVFVIPPHFQRDAVAGRKPTIEYYANMTYFVAGTFSYKAYRLVSVTEASQMLRATATEAGLPADAVGAVMSPMTIDINAIHNPWPNYSVYLTPSFSAGALALMVVLLTIFSITSEIKNGTARQWLNTAGGSILVAVAGKLLPQTVGFVVTGAAMLAIMFGFGAFPLYCSIWVMIAAMVLFVIANQAFGVFIASLLPNMRLALSVGALLCILAFSFTGFSFPVEQMYGSLAIFSYIMPVRYFFLIYINCALNGFALYYSRLYFVALLLFPLIGSVMLWRLKRAMLHPVYVP